MLKAPILLALLALASPTVIAAGSGSFYDPKAEYDRLDGVGDSHKKVDVIEWENNLEVHVYPGGSLKGLALKLDEGKTGAPVRPQDAAGAAKRKVMVIGYRFDNHPDRQYVRRNILGIPLKAGFHVYKDPSSGPEYDKIIISNNILGPELLAFATEGEPSESSPEGHPSNSKTQKLVESEGAAAQSRAPAEAAGTAPASVTAPAPKGGTYDEDSGSIKAFDYK